MPKPKLLSNEKIIYRFKPHWLFLVGPIAGLLLVLLAQWSVLCPLQGGFTLIAFCRIFVTLAILLVMIVLSLDWWFNRLYLTNYRVIKERGIIGKSYTSLWLVKIQDLTCRLTVWGRLFGFGDLFIESAGTYGQVPFKGFPEPQKIKGLIEEQIEGLLDKLPQNSPG